MDWNIIASICAIIGVFFLVYQFFYLPQKESKNEKEALLAHFYSTRAILDKLILEIETFVKDNNCLNREFANEATFKGQINHLIDIRNESLSDELFDKIREMPLTKEMISLMVKGLNEQTHSFHKASAYFRGRFVHQ